MYLLHYYFFSAFIVSQYYFVYLTQQLKCRVKENVAELVSIPTQYCTSILKYYKQYFFENNTN